MGARLGGRTELDPEVVALTAAHLRDYFPGLGERRLTHAWGGPDRRLPDPPAAGRAAARRRAPSSPPATPATASAPPTWWAARWPRWRSTAAIEHSRLAFVDPSPPRVPPEPFALDRRRGDPAGDHAQGGGRVAGPRARPAQRCALPSPRADRLSHRPLRSPRFCYRAAGTTSTGRSARCSSLFGVEPRITPFRGGSP